jgi:hypothetical protein
MSDLPIEPKENDDDELLEQLRLGGLGLIRLLVVRGSYRLSAKATALYEDGIFELEDLECAVCNGCLVKTERDEKDVSGRRRKYTICGPDVRGNEFYCVGKITKAEDGKLFVVITAKPSRRNYE